MSLAVINCMSDQTSGGFFRTPSGQAGLGFKSGFDPSVGMSASEPWLHHYGTVDHCNAPNDLANTAAWCAGVVSDLRSCMLLVIVIILNIIF